MAEDMDFAIDSIKEFLASPEAGEKIQSLLGVLGGGTESEKDSDESERKAESKHESKTALADIPVESIMKIASAYKSVSRQEDSRINLLRAIKPYVRKSRGDSVETAIKLLSFAKLAPLLGDIKEVLGGDY